MHKFTVTVHTLTDRRTYSAIGVSSAAVADAAIEQFGICSVSVMVQR